MPRYITHAHRMTKEKGGAWKGGLILTGTPRQVRARRCGAAEIRVTPSLSFAFSCDVFHSECLRAFRPGRSSRVASRRSGMATRTRVCVDSGACVRASLHTVAIGHCAMVHLATYSTQRVAYRLHDTACNSATYTAQHGESLPLLGRSCRCSGRRACRQHCARALRRHERLVEPRAVVGAFFAAKRNQATNQRCEPGPSASHL